MEAKVVEYVVVEAPTRREFQEAVNSHLAVGWELQGGVAIDSHGRYAQAMSKDKYKIVQIDG